MILAHKNVTLSLPTELYNSIEHLLVDNETILGFIEQAVFEKVKYRQDEKDVAKRALESRDKAKRTGIYVSAEEVFADLEDILNNARQKIKK